MSNIFVVSDTWFNRLLKDDPNENVVDNNDFIIQMWNEKVNPGDIVYVLGGFGIGDLYHILARLNGEIHFLNNYFNEDEMQFINNLRDEIYKSSDQEFKDRIVFENNQIVVLPENDVVLSYFPLESWCGRLTGTYCFHGFSESTNLMEHNISCVAKKWNYSPIKITEVQDNISTFTNILDN